MTEINKNPMPEINLFPRLQRVADFVRRAVFFFPAEAPDYMSGHHRGGAAMLDRELYDQLEEAGNDANQPPHPSL